MHTRTLLAALVGFLSFAGPVHAASAPVAVTGAVTTFSDTSATVTGTVNPNGQATTWHFDYGTTASYASSQNAGSGTTPVNFSAPVSGLRTGVVYHFRLVATNSAGTGGGADRTFTLVAAPSVTTGSASSVSATTVNLNGSVVPNGQETSWHFEFGTSTSYGIATATKSAGSGTSSTNVSAAVAGLTPGTTYHYRLVASNAAGTTPGADRTFTTAGAPVVSTAPAQSVAITSATLTGAVDPKTHTTDWYFEYGTSTSYGSRTPTPPGAPRAGNRGVQP